VTREHPTQVVALNPLHNTLSAKQG
jgi:hypothetical protein